MSVPVNLYVDRMSPVEPVRVADVYSVTQDRASIYTEAAAKMGLTPREYAEFRQALSDGGALYVRIPRYIDAMAGVHHRNHQVYVLRDVVVPTGTMGWEVSLTDGKTVIIPQICGNLSLNVSHVVAQHHPKPTVVAVVHRKQPKAVRAATYVNPRPVEVATTPVTFTEPVAIAPVAAASMGGGASAVHASLIPFAGLLLPIVASLRGGGGNTTVSSPGAPPCSLGSNTMGVCAGK